MFRCLPDQHEDEALLRASLKALRLQMKLLRDLTGYPLSSPQKQSDSGRRAGCRQNRTG